MKRILITGASGFIGRNLLRSLTDQGIETISWVRNSESATKIDGNRTHLLVGPLCNVGILAEQKNTIDGIVHLASCVSPRNQKDADDVNVGGTQTIVREIARWERPPVFLYVSSLAAAGPCIAGSHDPTSSDRPCSFYGKSKLRTEQMLRSLANDVPLSIIRPPSVIGAWDRNLLPLCSLVRWGINVVLSKISRYSFIHVDDLVRGMQAVLERGSRWGNSGSTSGVYYITDPQPITFVELGNYVADAMGVSRPRAIRIPAAGGWAIASVQECVGRILGRRTYLNFDKIREATAGSWVCSGQKMETELGFAVGASFPDRIRQTVDWYREHGWLSVVASKQTKDR